MLCTHSRAVACLRRRATTTLRCCPLGHCTLDLADFPYGTSRNFPSPLTHMSQMTVLSLWLLGPCVDSSVVQHLGGQLTRRGGNCDLFDDPAGEVFKGRIAFDSWAPSNINMERRFLLFRNLVHQSNQKVRAQSILLSLTHTHPIQPSNGVEMVINVPRSILLKSGFLGVNQGWRSLAFALHCSDEIPVILLFFKFDWDDHQFQAILALVALTGHETDIRVDSDSIACDANSKRHMVLSNQRQRWTLIVVGFPLWRIQAGFVLEPQHVQTAHFSDEVRSASSFQECPKDRRTWLGVT